MTALEKATAKMEAFYADPSDPRNWPNPRHTYDKVVKPITPEELQRRIDIVNGIRGHGPLAEFQGDGVA